MYSSATGQTQRCRPAAAAHAWALVDSADYLSTRLTRKPLALAARHAHCSYQNILHDAKAPLSIRARKAELLTTHGYRLAWIYAVPWAWVPCICPVRFCSRGANAALQMASGPGRNDPSFCDITHLPSLLIMWRLLFWTILCLVSQPSLTKRDIKHQLLPQRLGQLRIVRTCDSLTILTAALSIPIAAQPATVSVASPISATARNQ